MLIEFMVLFEFALTPKGPLKHICLFQVFDELN